MKKAVIYVFSGTGNTRLVADLYKKNLSEYETTIYDVKMKKVSADSSKFEFQPFPNPNEFDLIGFDKIVPFVISSINILSASSIMRILSLISSIFSGLPSRRCK